MVNQGLNKRKVYTGCFGRLRYITSGLLLMVGILGGSVPFVLADRDIAIFSSFAILLLPVASLLLLISVYALNQFPAITLVERGIVIDYNFRPLLIPWAHLKSITGDRRLRFGRVYIFSDALPALYAMYGLERATPGRAFIIDPTLSTRDLRAIVDFIAVHCTVNIDVGYYMGSQRATQKQTE